MMKKCAHCNHTEDRNHLVNQTREGEWKHYRIGGDGMTHYDVFTKKCKFCSCTLPSPSFSSNDLNKEECEAEIRNFAKQSVMKCYKDNKKLIDALGNKKDGVTLRPIYGRHLRVVKEGK
jgi:hypothetical protein